MSRSSLSLLLAVFLTLFLGGEGAIAATSCTFVSVTDVNFGSYDVLSAMNNDSTGGITVDCDLNSWTTVIISIGPSPNSGGFNPRKMIGTPSGDLLNYYLYRNIARTEIWGDGTLGTYTVTLNIQKNKPQTPTVYGRIPPGQNVGVGNYGEILVVTINF